MKNSIQALTLSSLGLNGSKFITGTETYSNPDGWVAFRTAATGCVISSIVAPNVIGVEYLIDKTLSDPYEFLGNFTSITLSSGAIQAFS